MDTMDFCLEMQDAYTPAPAPKKVRKPRKAPTRMKPLPIAPQGRFWIHHERDVTEVKQMASESDNKRSLGERFSNPLVYTTGEIPQPDGSMDVVWSEDDYKALIMGSIQLALVSLRDTSQRTALFAGELNEDLEYVCSEVFDIDCQTVGLDGIALKSLVGRTLKGVEMSAINKKAVKFLELFGTEVEDLSGSSNQYYL